MATVYPNPALSAFPTTFKTRGTSASFSYALASGAPIVVTAAEAELLVESFGTPSGQRAFSLTPWGPIIAPVGIPSGEAFGSAVVSVAGGALTISPAGIASAEAFGTPAVLMALVVQPSAIASAEAFGTPTVSVASLTYAASVLADSPLLFWRMAQASYPNYTTVEPNLGSLGGTDGNGISLTTTTGATTDGNAAVQAASGAMYTTANLTTLAHASQARTVEGWFYRDNSASNHMLIAGGSTTNQGAPYVYAPGLSTRTITVAPNGNVGTTSNFTNAWPVGYGVGVWTHVAAAWNGTNTYLWVNGVPQTPQANTSMPTGTWSVFSAGVWQYGPGTNNFGLWQGKLDEIAVYNGVLSDARVLAHYNAR